MPIKYSGVANGRVLTEELYTHRIQIFLHLFTELFRKDVSPILRITTANLFWGVGRQPYEMDL